VSKQTRKPPRSGELTPSLPRDASAREERAPLDLPNRSGRIFVHLASSCALVVIGAVCYSNSLVGEFHLDDFIHIVENRNIRRLDAALADLASKPRHLVTFTFALNYAISGLNTFSYHLVNLSIHLLAGLTLQDLVRRVLRHGRAATAFRDRADALAFAVALLWLVHPLQTQAVTYIAQRYESLMGLFYLLMLNCLVRGMTALRPLGWYACAVVFCLLGMQCKEVMVTAPFVALLLDRAYFAASWRETFARRKWLYVALLVTSFALVHSVTFAFSGEELSVGFQIPITPWYYFRSQPLAILQYLRLAVWPDELCFDYRQPVATLHQAWLPGVIVLGLVALAIWLYWKYPAIGFLLLSFFLILAPTSTFLPLADIIVEHRMYLPLAPLVTLVVLGSWQGLLALAARRGWPETQAATLAAIALMLAVLALGTRTFIRNADYYTGESLWFDTILKSPNNFRAHCNLGIALVRRGEYEAAATSIETSIRLNPNHPVAHWNLGRAYIGLNRLEEAIQALRAARRLYDDAPESLLLVECGNVLMTLGRHEEALESYREAVQVNPTNPVCRGSLGTVLLRLGRHSEAETQFRKALELRPGNPFLLADLAWALHRQGKRDEARETIQKVLDKHPTWANDMLGAAWQTATTPSHKDRNGRVALDMAQEVEDLSGTGVTAASRLVTAAALAEIGRRDDALQAAEAALNRCTNDVQRQVVSHTLEAIRQGGPLYAARLPDFSPLLDGLP
jgi:tetratricopeptide (TPR) repeat protein